MLVYSVLKIMQRLRVWLETGIGSGYGVFLNVLGEQILTQRNCEP